MTRLENRSVFFSKVMLFGEYSLMAGSQALTIPFHAFSGSLELPDKLPATEKTMAKASNRQLWSFFQFLSDASKASDLRLVPELSLERFEADLDNGIYFRSTIPSGYGLGSSGALVAAVFSLYSIQSGVGWGSGDFAQQALNQRGLISGGLDATLGILAQPGWKELKTQLAAMESFFHGTSSGIDPLSCLAGKPLLADPGGEVRLADLKPFRPEFPGGFFLLDTSTTGKTGPLVQAFLQKYQEPDFRDLIDKRYVPLINACIASLLRNNAGELLSLLTEVSAFQRAHFHPMIPEHMKEAWDHGLDTGAYSLKLCGSGGGGYLLVFTGDLQQAREELRMHNLLPVRMEPPG